MNQTVQVYSVNAFDVRAVLGNMFDEIDYVAKAAPFLISNYDRMQAMQDVGVFCLYEVVDTISFEVYTPPLNLVREYRFVLLNEPTAAYGPVQPPMGYVPQEARLRLVVMPNPRMSWEYCEDWFAQLGWTAVDPLVVPANARYETYGCFSSGGFSVSRNLLSNPAFDWGPTTATGRTQR